MANLNYIKINIDNREVSIMSLTYTRQLLEIITIQLEFL
jgi:hypothetical protein